MTPKRRIFLNIIATYGRSIFALLCGFFTSRWFLQSLGAVDYGLYGVVAGLTVFISFFNGMFSSAISRFYAFAVGGADKSVQGLEECRKWFCTAVFINTVIPGILILLGYPLGDFLIRNWLDIPIERVSDCRVVFMWVCVTCFVGMLNVPFNAMYVAKQRIAELTVYSFLGTVCKVAVAYYMVTHPGVWLSRYAVLMCIISITPQLMITVNAFRGFPECKLSARYLVSRDRIRCLAAFAGWQLFGHLGALARGQGVALLVNRQFGPCYNASMAIAGTLTSYADSLAASMNGAFSPAIANRAGAGARESALNMTYWACKLGGVFSLVFILPLLLEIDAILQFWLKNPPPMVAEACILTLVTMAVEETVRGVGIVVTAYGDIAKFYFILGVANVLSLPAAWFVVWSGAGGFPSVFATLLVFKIAMSFAAVAIAKRIVGISPGKWFADVFLRLLMVSLLAFAAGNLIKSVFADLGCLRILFSCTAVTCAFAILTWYYVLGAGERAVMLEKIAAIKYNLVYRHLGKKM